MLTRWTFGLLLFLAGCGNHYTVFRSQTSEPILLTRSAYTWVGCMETLQREGAGVDMTFRYIHIKGSFFGDTLLWPFYKGYSCEAAIGPERSPSGVYSNGLPPLP